MIAAFLRNFKNPITQEGIKELEELFETLTKNNFDGEGVNLVVGISISIFMTITLHEYIGVMRLVHISVCRECIQKDPSEISRPIAVFIWGNFAF